MSEAFDFNAFSKRESAKWEAMALSDRARNDDKSFKQNLKIALKARDDRAALVALAAELEGKIDAAAWEHARKCDPIQAELERPETTPTRRVELRAQVNDANALLESIVAPLRRQLTAVRQEADLLAVKASSVQTIQNAFAETGPEEQRHRLKVLRKAEELMAAITFGARKKAESHDVSLRHEKERRASGERGKYDLDDLEAAARFHNDVHGALVSLERQLFEEREEIRRKRLEELYAD